MRTRTQAALPAIALIVVVVLVVAAIGIYYLASSAGYGSDDDYIPTMELTLSSRSNGVIYDADVEMEVANAKFIDYFFSTASASTSDPGFPKGNTELVVTIYDEPINADMDPDSILFKGSWKVGNLYQYQDDTQETTWTIDLPMLKDVAPADEGAFYLYVQVKAGGSTIGTSRVTCNPEAA